MKRIGIFLCCILILQMLCACNAKTDNFKEPAYFYYCNQEVSYNTPTGIIQPEIREGAELHENLTAFLHAYLRGPVSQDLQRTIPADVYLVSCAADTDTVSIVFNTQFSKLNGVKLICACSALLMSVHDFTGAQTLAISVKDGMIEEKNVFIITMDDIVWMDTVTIEK